MRNTYRNADTAPLAKSTRSNIPANTSVQNDPWVTLSAISCQGAFSLPGEMLTSWDRERQSRKRRTQRLAAFYALLVTIGIGFIVAKLLRG